MRIRTEKLHRAFNDAGRELTVIESLSFEFPQCGSMGIVGRSGIGKSTLLHLLGGLERPNAGRILFEEQDLTAFSDDDLSVFRGGKIGFIFQFHHLLPEFDAVENVSMPLIIAGTRENEAALRAREVLSSVGLAQRLTHRPGQLSGGEQQRVAIARAIVTRPEVILADEPTGNLDFHTARQVQDILMESHRALKNLLIIVTHNMELAESLDVMYEMQPGGRLELVKRAGVQI